MFMIMTNEFHENLDFKSEFIKLNAKIVFLVFFNNYEIKSTLY